MRRNINGNQTRELIRKIREEAPGIALRTTMLVGFPGETEEDFQELLDFIREVKFDRLGVFPYSHEDDTWAAKNLTDEIPPEIKQERADWLMEIQQSISEELTARKIGQTLKVIIDREEGEFFVGRTEFDSPEVDGEVLIKLNQNIEVGEFYNVFITSSDMFDLYGEIV
jgi:ribosomal protein S12 methylthiotransferase